MSDPINIYKAEKTEGTSHSNSEQIAICPMCKHREATIADSDQFGSDRWDAIRRNTKPQADLFPTLEEARHICWRNASSDTRLTEDEKAADADTLRAILVETRTYYDRLACGWAQ